MKKRFKLSAGELSWVLYDVGNSAFVLVIITALMPIFFKDVVAVTMSGAESTARWGFANSLSALVLALLAPLLGAMADHGARKKQFLLFFLGLGVGFTLLLTTVGANQWLYCLFLLVIARIGWGGANIFYDAFLVDVATYERMDRVSALGYGYGYVGSVVPFVLIIGLIFSAGISGGLPVHETRMGFAVVALWWLGLSVPLVLNVRQRYRTADGNGSVIYGLRRVAATFLEISSHHQIFVFLAAYFFYIDGIGTLISMSTAYGIDLGFSPAMMLVVLLFIQLVAFPSTIVYGWLSGRFGVKNMLYCGIAIYIVATVMGFCLSFELQPLVRSCLFWAVAFLIASAMGGMQALSRSYFARLIPVERSAEFFGFYNVFGKFAAISGPLLMGLVAAATGQSRWGLLSILVLFAAGGLLLARVEDPGLDGD
ncbi:MFS transporter [Desulforhopalus singaporensis]|uniref:MFS transporter, UMF1 family n=1 Tax=Desulforhopalus singaporensis TaxID=91360 RepID=A0A1H0K0G6_9BACT|nr:MFS transporter [Desulforhopalus singaporensis]SDO49364.1 MFS transporter, UMF1 family [Desulforhopalus singaporensis]